MVQPEEDQGPMRRLPPPPRLQRFAPLQGRPAPPVAPLKPGPGIGPPPPGWRLPSDVAHDEAEEAAEGYRRRLAAARMVDEVAARVRRLEVCMWLLFGLLSIMVGVFVWAALTGAMFP